MIRLLNFTVSPWASPDVIRNNKIVFMDSLCHPLKKDKRAMILQNKCCRSDVWTFIILCNEFMVRVFHRVKKNRTRNVNWVSPCRDFHCCIIAALTHTLWLYIVMAHQRQLQFWQWAGWCSPRSQTRLGTACVGECLCRGPTIQLRLPVDSLSPHYWVPLVVWHEAFHT